MVLLFLKKCSNSRQLFMKYENQKNTKMFKKFCLNFYAYYFPNMVHYLVPVPSTSLGMNTKIPNFEHSEH